jgi:hypothetical protein
VTIAPLPPGAAPDLLRPGVRRVTPAFVLDWPDARLQKTGTLEFSYAGAPVPSGTTPVLYESAPGDTSWKRVGGTPLPSGSAVAAAFQRPARYALFAESSAPAGGEFLTGLTLAPRVFAPEGGSSSPRLAIGFQLGQQAPVTVKIYNRAGRHVATVTEGIVYGPGQNLVYWDGRDRDGMLAGEGLYVVSVEALEDRQTKTVAVVK